MLRHAWRILSIWCPSWFSDDATALPVGNLKWTIQTFEIPLRKKKHTSHVVLNFSLAVVTNNN